MKLNIKKLIRKVFPDVIAILVFVIISAVYMYPALSGKIIAQHDSTAGIGATNEVIDYNKETGEISRWNNSIFSGMPTYQSTPSYPALIFLDKIAKVYHLFLPPNIWLLFVLLLGFYILMRTMKFNVFISSLGAIIWAFSSYFIIIISAGHIWKLMTLAYIPPTIAGMILIFRRKYMFGFAVTAFFSAMQLQSNHIQMTYYFLFVMLALAVGYFVDALKKKEIKSFATSTAVLIAAGLIAVAVNSSNLYHTYQYSKETMRGGSELAKSDSGNQTVTGLDRDYITQWSYGIDETMTLLIPNFKGGANAKGDKFLSMADSKTAMSASDKKFRPLYKQLPQYFGEQPFTCGPVYVGAFVCLLFVLGLILVTGPVKWALLSVTILSVLLSWGRNFQWFTDLFIDYMPLYSKFRTVSSILVIAEFTIPLLGVLGLAKFLELSSNKEKKANLALLLSFVITGGLALSFALFPSLSGVPITNSELSAFNDLVDSYKAQGYAFPIAELIDDLSKARFAMISSDAWRSLIFIVIGFLITFFAGKGKVNHNIAVALIAFVCLVDMWGIDKRYLSVEMFKRKTEKKAEYKKTPADEYILEDKSLDYRVLNLSTDTFNENFTSYYHKSIGGYHAAKLRRYQELIEEHIVPEISRFKSSFSTDDLPVINMLNAKYFILPNTQGDPIPYLNENAFGNAWFVNSVSFVNNANEEISALHIINPKSVAVIDKKFCGYLSEKINVSSATSVEMTDYKPNELTYKISSDNGGVVVFSEIYYPGWKATIDGNISMISRADYVLRALEVPAGEHNVVFEFRPSSLKITDTISIVALVLMFLMFLIPIVKPFIIKK